MADPTVGAIVPFQNQSLDHHHHDDNHDFSSFFHQLLHAHDDDNNNNRSLDFIDQMVMIDGPDDFIPWAPLSDGDDDGVAVVNNHSANPSINNHNNDDDTVLRVTAAQMDQHHHHEIGGTSNGGDGNNESHDNQGTENINAIMPLQVLPNNNPPVSYPCSCCQVLREIVHTNGIHTTKFEIHGRVGLVAHAILEHHYNSNEGDGAPVIKDYQMLDFCRQSIENVKEYLKEYFEEHRQKGYTLLQEPLSFFYEALCIGYDWVDTHHHDPADHRHRHDSTGEQHAQLIHAETSNQAVLNPQVPANSQTYSDVPNLAMESTPSTSYQVPSRTEVSVQRERIKNMTFGDFAKYFDHPIEIAAKQLRLCATVIKKKLRSYNVNRWPYRKIKGIKKKISEWTKNLGVENTEARVRAEKEICKLQRQLDDILNGNIETLMNI